MSQLSAFVPGQLRDVVSRGSQAVSLAVQLCRDLATPLPVQLAEQIRDRVTSGALPAGSRLPSSRALAADLAVSRTVVEQAYDQLTAEGWASARRGSGTFVSTVAAPRTASSDRHSSWRLAVASPGGIRQGEGGPTQPPLVPLDTGTPWWDARAEAGWRRAWRQVALSRMPPGYPDAAGLWELRVELAAYLERRRAIVCRPEQVLVTTGTTHGWGLLLDALPPGPVAVEDPGYRAAVAVARDAGRAVLDLPVDDRGVQVEVLRESRLGIVATYVTPAHQHPLGVTLDASRRVALVQQARAHASLVVEDDYDSEFRYDVAPLPALAALDSEHVVYLGTASKIVQPGLRIGWLVATPELVAELAARRAARHDHPSWPTQVALVSLLREGNLDKLVRASRRVYRARSQYLQDRLGEAGYDVLATAGMYITVPTSAATERQAVRALADAGFELQPLSSFCRTADRHGIVLGFGGVDDTHFARAVDAMLPALAESSGAD